MYIVRNVSVKAENFEFFTVLNRQFLYTVQRSGQILNIIDYLVYSLLYFN